MVKNTKICILLIAVTATVSVLVYACSQGSDNNTNPPQTSPPPQLTHKVKDKELINSKPISGDFTTNKEKYFYFNGSVGSFYDISWSGNISVSAFHSKKDGETIFSGDISESIKIQSDKAERIYLKITPLEANASYTLKYEINNPAPPETWTFMVYLNGTDTLDILMRQNIRNMLKGYHDNISINVVLLLDKDRDSPWDILDERFADTRMYMIVSNDENPDNGKLSRIWEGGEEFDNINSETPYEANMGDAITLKKFINFSKKNFPASHYVLILKGHGNGPAGVSLDSSHGSDTLQIGEISYHLKEEQKVDVLGFDSCLMGSLEVAYQFRNDPDGNNGRFYADVLIACPGEVNIHTGWGYEGIFKRINPKGGTLKGQTDDLGAGGEELIYNPRNHNKDDLNALTPLRLGDLFVEELWDYINDEFSISERNGEGLTCYDLKKVIPLKKSVDRLAKSLFENRDAGEIEALESYRDNPKSVFNYSYRREAEGECYIQPLFDLYYLASRIENDGVAFSVETIAEATNVLNGMDEMTHRSYLYWLPHNQPVLSIFFTDYKNPGLEKDPLCWDNFMTKQWWYTPINLYTEPDPLWNYTQFPERCYGNMDFCRFGLNSEGNVVDLLTNNTHDNVENWFELLDYRYYNGDPGIGAKNEYNNYRY